MSEWRPPLPHPEQFAQHVVRDICPMCRGKRKRCPACGGVGTIDFVSMGSIAELRRYVDAVNKQRRLQ